MTRILFVRHGHMEEMEIKIHGRAQVGLSAKGTAQIEELARGFDGVKLDALYTSPVRRTRETADILAKALGLKPQAIDDLAELDFGRWSGGLREDLEKDELYRRFNAFRSGTRIPGGESMIETQTRAAKVLERVRDEHPDGAVALVSHGDVIRSALCFCLGMPLDLWLRLAVEPASVSAVDFGEWGVRLLALNFPGPIKRIMEIE